MQSSSNPNPEILVLVYCFASQELRTLNFPYYRSKKGRICFRYGPGLYGMKTKRIGQFEIGPHFAYMYVYRYKDIDRYASEAHFLRCVIKRIKKCSEPLSLG